MEAFREGDKEIEFVEEQDPVEQKLEGVVEAINALPERMPKIPPFPEIPPYPEFPKFPEQKTIDLKKVERLLGEIAAKEQNVPESKDYTKSLEELKKLVGEEKYTELLKGIADSVGKPKFNEAGRLLVAVDKYGDGGSVSSVHMKDVSGEAINPATEEKQDDIIAALGGGVKIKKIDEALPYTYIGEAAVGTATSAASWSIKRIDETNDPDTDILYAGTGAYDQIWDNRVGLSYN